MALTTVPYSAVFDLGLVPQGGKEIVLSPKEGERAAIANWLGIEGLDTLTARIVISRKGDDRYSYAAHFEADVVQACVVTLDPVRAHLSGTYERLFQVMPRSSARRRKPATEPATVDILLGDEDGPERLENPIINLAAPLIEELSLALDPYPRAPGVSFEPPADEAEAADNPFAVLEKLKNPALPGKKKG